MGYLEKNFVPGPPAPAIILAYCTLLALMLIFFLRGGERGRLFLKRQATSGGPDSFRIFSLEMGEVLH